MTPNFKSRFPLLLPRTEDCTPRWQRITELAESQPENFDIVSIPGGFRQIVRKPNIQLDEQIVRMFTKMNIAASAIADILEIDPIQTIPTAIRALWTARGFKVAERGVITVQFISGDKEYQYPFIEVEDGNTK